MDKTRNEDTNYWNLRETFVENSREVFDAVTLKMDWLAESTPNASAKSYAETIVKELRFLYNIP